MEFPFFSWNGKNHYDWVISNETFHKTRNKSKKEIEILKRVYIIDYNVIKEINFT